MHTKKIQTLSPYTGFAILVVMGGILLGLYVLQQYQSRVWNYNGRFNVFDVDTFTLMSYPSTDSESIVQIDLPKDAYFLVPEGYGYYKLEDVVELSRVEKRGVELVLKSVSYSLGIPVDTDANSLKGIDKLRIWKNKQVSSRDIRTISLENEPIFSTETRKDNVDIDKIDPNKVDRYLADILWERAVKEEPYTVAVYNATDFPGLATGIGRMLEHVGYRVVEIANWDEGKQEACRIIVYGDESIQQSASLRRLTHLFSCPLEFNTDKEERYTFEIVVTDAI